MIFVSTNRMPPQFWPGGIPIIEHWDGSINFCSGPFIMSYISGKKYPSNYRTVVCTEKYRLQFTNPPMWVQTGTLDLDLTGIS